MDSVWKYVQLVTSDWWAPSAHVWYVLPQHAKQLSMWLLG